MPDCMRACLQRSPRPPVFWRGCAFAGSTLDGFDFGFGGILPIGGAFDGFGFTINKILFVRLTR